MHIHSEQGSRHFRESSHWLDLGYGVRAAARSLAVASLQPSRTSLAQMLGCRGAGLSSCAHGLSSLVPICGKSHRGTESPALTIQRKQPLRVCCAGCAKHPARIADLSVFYSGGWRNASDHASRVESMSMSADVNAKTWSEAPALPVPLASIPSLLIQERKRSTAAPRSLWPFDTMESLERWISSAAQCASKD